MDKTFSIITLGCKLNQFDSESIREALLRREWEYRGFDEGARYCIINSCTVTAKSDARCRNAVRRTRRMAPDAFIVVTGCYAETQRERLEAMEEVDLVVGNGDKRSLPVILDRLAGGTGPPEDLIGADIRTLPIERFLDHSRAFVKVQDGCDASCSYCIVPRARGRSRSVGVDEVLRQIELLHGNGYREIVLTGIHVGRYGADLDPPNTLASLVETILERTGVRRLRLSSIEPTEVTPRLLSLVRETDRVAPHLHIPLQSGDDFILAAMNRPYRAAEFRNRIEEIARARNGVAIGTDILVGFPGETEERFENTFSLVRDLPISLFHVFTFSPRPLTPASTMSGAASFAAAKSRSARLIELGAAKRLDFLQSHVGTVHAALIERHARAASGYVRSLTDTYCEVYVPTDGIEAGSLVPVRIRSLSRGSLYGTPLDLRDARIAGPGACAR